MICDFRIFLAYPLLLQHSSREYGKKKYETVLFRKRNGDGRDRCENVCLTNTNMEVF